MAYTSNSILELKMFNAARVVMGDHPSSMVSSFSEFSNFSAKD
jgi:hypothetical protein